MQSHSTIVTCLRGWSCAVVRMRTFLGFRGRASARHLSGNSLVPAGLFTTLDHAAASVYRAGRQSACTVSRATSAFLPFELEKWQSLYENGVDYNLADSGVTAVHMHELLQDQDAIDRLLSQDLHYPPGDDWLWLLHSPLQLPLCQMCCIVKENSTASQIVKLISVVHTVGALERLGMPCNTAYVTYARCAVHHWQAGRLSMIRKF